jgi:uncharacterized protein (DUF58 family)
MRLALAGLTTRGRSFLAAGLAACLCGLGLGEADLLRVGLFLCVLPIATATVVARTRFRLSAHRRLEPARVPMGETAQVVLRLENLSRVPTGILLLEDRLPYSLGGRPRFVLNRVEAHGVREVSYPVRSDVRGRYLVGPLSLRFADLFGLVELTRSFTSTEALIVTPAVVALGTSPLGGDLAGGGENRARAISTTGEDDVTPREYRYGDDLRRVHWRSTARLGELMVRREEQPWQNRGTLFLDTRAIAHRGDGPASSFEWSVGAVASIGCHLARHGFGLRLVTDTGEGISGYSRDATSGTSFEGLLLDTLAMVTPSPDQSLSDGIAAVRRGGGGVVIAVLGALSHADLDNLVRLRHHASSCIAVLLDTASWQPGPATEAAARTFGQSHALLSQAGWRVLPAVARTDLRMLWGGGAPVTTADLDARPGDRPRLQPVTAAGAPGRLG